MRDTAARQTLTVEEAAAILGISRTHAYGLAKRGELPVIRLGCRFVIARTAIEVLLGERVNLGQERQAGAA